MFLCMATRTKTTTNLPRTKVYSESFGSGGGGTGGFIGKDAIGGGVGECFSGGRFLKTSSSISSLVGSLAIDS